MARTKPVQARSKEMRARILAATAQVLAERGYAGLSTNRVAAQAGVSVGSLYRYFEDRTDLLEHLRQQVTERVVVDLSGAMVDAVRQEPFAGVRHVVSTLVDLLIEHGPVVKALIDEVPFGSHANALPALEQQLGQFARLFTAQQAPWLAAEEVDARVYLALGFTLSACLRTALERPQGIDPERLIDLTTSLLVAGLTLP